MHHMKRHLALDEKQHRKISSNLVDLMIGKHTLKLLMLVRLTANVTHLHEGVLLDVLQRHVRHDVVVLVWHAECGRRRTHPSCR